MLTPAVYFVQVILALHILFVVVAFGVMFSYPLFMLIGPRLDPRAMPWFHRMQQVIGRYLINPGLLLVVIFGVILASKLHAWHVFYVQWGIGAVIVIGAIEGSFMIPREGRLAELAQRDLDAATAGPGEAGSTVATRSAEYAAQLRNVAIGALVIDVIVILTVYVMATQAGA
jgi:hypothetical protein